MSEFFASEDDYQRLIESVGPREAARLAKQEGWQIRPKETKFMPVSAMGGGNMDDDENAANVAENEAADEAAAEAYAGLGGLSAMDLTNPKDISRAILANSQQQKLYYDQLANEIKQRRYGPSETEKLLALSAAFFQPTSVRGFSGTMGNVLPVLQKFGELKRTGEEERREALQNLTKQRMALAQGDVKTALELQRLMRTYPSAGMGYDTQRGIMYNRANPRPTEEFYNVPGLGKLVKWQDGLWRHTAADGKTYVYERYGDEYKFLKEEAPEGTK